MRQPAVLMSFDPGVQRAFDWLVDGAAGATNPVAVVARLLPELVAAGLPVDRFAANVRTLHPGVVARAFSWQPGGAVKVVEHTWAQLEHPAFLASPIKKVFDEGREIRGRLMDGETLGFPFLEEMRAQGFTDYLILPLRFMAGSTHSASYATQAPGGFSEEHIQALRHVTRALTRVAETLALMRTAVNLLNTYVGREAGERIWAGSITRGSTECIDCVVWFSDIRGFTTMSGERTPAEVIAVLNELFDCQVPAIEANGGQVLKFMGDGILAIFPISELRSARVAGDAAVEATHRAFAALALLNARRAANGEEALRFGVALHVGEVGYGNIGGANRLDFTAIGPVVNLASRIEGLTGKLDRPVLISEALALQLGVPTRVVGEFELKGVARPQAVHELV